MLNARARPATPGSGALPELRRLSSGVLGTRANRLSKEKAGGSGETGGTGDETAVVQRDGLVHRAGGSIGFIWWK